METNNIKMETNALKPFKVTSTQSNQQFDKQFKGIAARNLLEMKQKCFNSFNQQFPPTASVDDIDLMLHEDRTLIDDEDYFSMLPENSKLLVMCSQQKDTLPCCETDVTDGSIQNTSTSVESEMGDFQGTLPRHIVEKFFGKGLSECIISLVTMSNEELDLFLDFDIDNVAIELNLDPSEVSVIIDSAAKELGRREELSRAAQLLKLYEKAKSQGYGDGKRKRTLDNVL